MHTSPQALPPASYPHKLPNSPDKKRLYDPIEESRSEHGNELEQLFLLPRLNRPQDVGAATF
ncbi:hypothetical protein HanRHA438_Chr01g0040981 [Helianthus annuus]|nr:hypothetical protein HanRHA438_Chr01g0040981 [Helianthus annuus]